MPLVSELNAETARKNQEFAWFRGGFLSCFSQTEYLFLRLIERMNKTAPFEGYFKTTPYKFESRIKAFIELFEAQEELQDFATEANRLADLLAQSEPIRNYLAHGFARYDAGEELWTVYQFRPSNSDPWQQVELKIDPGYMIQNANLMDDLAQSTFVFCRHLNDAFDLGL